MSEQQPPQPPPPPTQPTPPASPPPAPAGGGATWQGVQPVVERPTEAMPPVPPPTPPPAPPGPGPGGGGAGGGGSRSGLVAAIVVVVVAILGVGGYLLFAGGDDEDDQVAVEDDETTTTDEDSGDDETTTTEAEETTTTEAEETTTTAGDAGGELSFAQVTDDSGRLVVEVPDTWTQVDGTPLGDGAPNVQASTDLEAFRQLQASGISFTLLNQQNADPDATLDFLTADHVDSCEVQPRQDYDDGVFRGRLQELTNCGGQGITLFVIVASNEAGQSVEVSTIIVPPDPAEEIEQHIIETFNVRS